VKRIRTLINYISVGLLAAAIYQELKKQPEERTLHGKVFGFVPYDFRPPTVERLLRVYWNPEDPRVITEPLFGIGWAINFYSVFERLRGQKRAAL